jgi:N-acetylmuramoyl-L-alanine amidase
MELNLFFRRTPKPITTLLITVSCLILSFVSNQIPKVQASTAGTVTYQTTKAFQQYKPRYTIIMADASNYGDRFSTDVNGKKLNNQPLAVLHETVGSASSAINTFRVPHRQDNQQVSYHALITLDCTIVYLVPPEKRAFGAGNSVFVGKSGPEAVQTNSKLPPSVNNFAYHVSLETPLDGQGKYSKNKSHSGYTDSQYKSLAWLLATSSIPDERITTHQKVDRSGQRFDPRNFDFQKFLTILHTYRQANVS